jgi:hypothetical protein
VNDAEALTLEPRPCCPCCAGKVTGVGAGGEAYPLPDVIGGRDPVPYRSHRLEPCGCRVSEEWAVAYRFELEWRKDGNPPQAVVDVTPMQRRQLVEAVEERLCDAYSLRDKARTPEDAAYAQYLLSAYTDRLMRLSPPAKRKPDLGNGYGEKYPMPSAYRKGRDLGFGVPIFGAPVVIPGVDDKAKGKKSLDSVNFLPEGDGSVWCFFPDGVRHRYDDWGQMEADLRAMGYDTANLLDSHKYQSETAQAQGMLGPGVDLPPAPHFVTPPAGAKKAGSGLRTLPVGKPPAHVAHEFPFMGGVLTLSQWWQQACHEAEKLWKGRAPEKCYQLAKWLLEVAPQGREELLSHGKKSYTLAAQVESCLRQMEKGAVVAVAGQAGPQGTLLHGETFRTLLGQVVRVIRRNRHFAVQLVNAQLAPGCCRAEAEGFLHGVAHSVDEFLSAGDALSQDADRFVCAYLGVMAGATPAEAQAKIADVERAAAANDSELFHRQFRRAGRKIRPVKKGKKDG